MKIVFRFVLIRYDLDGDGVVTSTELRTMLSHIPSAFKILEASMQENWGGAVSSEIDANLGDDEETRQRIEDIVENVFKDRNSVTLNFDEFCEVISTTPAILEIINIFYDEALPERELASRTSAITDAPMPRLSSRLASGFGTPKLTSPESHPFRSITPIRRTASASSGSNMSEVISSARTSPSRSNFGQALKCPMCNKDCSMEHCVLCGGKMTHNEPDLSSSQGSPSSMRPRFKCEGCSFSIPDIAYCFSCGQPLRHMFGGSLSVPRLSAHVLPAAASVGNRSSAPSSHDGGVVVRSLAVPLNHSPNPSAPTSEYDLPIHYEAQRLPMPTTPPRSGSLTPHFVSPRGSTSPTSPSSNPMSRDCTSESDSPVSNLFQKAPMRRSNRGSPNGQMFGYMSKMGRITNISKTRFFRLQDRFLYYYKNDSDTRPKGVIFLEGSRVSAMPASSSMLPGISKKTFGLEVEVINSAFKRQFFCTNQSERDLWVAALAKSSNTVTIDMFYEVDAAPISQGKFAKVHAGTSIAPPHIPVAVKVISKNKMSAQDREYVRTEVAILRLAKHPFLVRMYDVFDGTDSISIVLERIQGGDLLRRLRVLPGCRLEEDSAKKVVACICQAICYLHDRGIIHRDIKPENILVVDGNTESLLDIQSVKVTDFGLSAIASHLMHQALGTVAYAAPEVLMHRPYGKQVDTWSIGAVTYVTLSGRMPFAGNKDKDIAKNAANGRYTFSKKPWPDLSDDSKRFITKCMTTNPENRPSVHEALKHAWLEGTNVMDEYVSRASRTTTLTTGERTFESNASADTSGLVISPHSPTGYPVDLSRQARLAGWSSDKYQTSTPESNSMSNSLTPVSARSVVTDEESYDNQTNLNNS